MARLNGTFDSLRHRNYRLYFVGHTISVTGTWMQRIGQAWLVLELTGSGTMLGVTAALQHLPTLFFGPWGGLLADRLNKRKLLLFTQSSAGILALLLALVIASGDVTIEAVLAFALALGLVEAADGPTRHSFVYELVGPDLIANATTLNSVIHNAAKAVGPALAGALIAVAGIAPSFFLNALSYAAVVLALILMRPAELLRGRTASRGKGQLREGLRHVKRTPALAAPLALMFVSGLFAYEWAVTLPLLAQGTFGGDARTFGAMFSAMGVGAVLGGLVVAGSMRTTMQSLLRTATSFSLLVLCTAFSPMLSVALVCLVGVGATSIALRALATSLLQVNAEPHMRGRVTGLLVLAVSGTTPIGGPLVGWVGEVIGPRTALGLGGLATGIAVLVIWVRSGRSPGGRVHVK